MTLPKHTFLLSRETLYRLGASATLFDVKNGTQAFGTNSSFHTFGFFRVVYTESEPPSYTLYTVCQAWIKNVQ